MKLAEALLLRADLQTKLARLRDRIAKNARHQEGDKPSEDPNQLLKEAAGIVHELAGLIVRINRTNITVKVPKVGTMTEAVAARDALKQEHATVAAAIAATTVEPERYSMREIKWVAAVDVPRLQKQLEQLSVRIREANTRIQEVNWSAELKQD